MPIDGIRRLTDRIGALFQAARNFRFYGVQGNSLSATTAYTWTAPGPGRVDVIAWGPGGAGCSLPGDSGAAGRFSNFEVSQGDTIGITIGQALTVTNSSGTWPRAAPTTVTMPGGRVGVAEAGGTSISGSGTRVPAAAATGFDDNLTGNRNTAGGSGTDSYPGASNPLLDSEISPLYLQAQEATGSPDVRYGRSPGNGGNRNSSGSTVYPGGNGGVHIIFKGYE